MQVCAKYVLLMPVSCRIPGINDRLDRVDNATKVKPSLRLQIAVLKL